MQLNLSILVEQVRRAQEAMASWVPPRRRRRTLDSTNQKSECFNVSFFVKAFLLVLHRIAPV